MRTCSVSEKLPLQRFFWCFAHCVFRCSPWCVFWCCPSITTRRTVRITSTTARVTRLTNTTTRRTITIARTTSVPPKHFDLKCNTTAVLGDNLLLEVSYFGLEGLAVRQNRTGIPFRVTIDMFKYSRWSLPLG